MDPPITPAADIPGAAPAPPKDAVCPVCLEDMPLDRNLVITGCGHTFCFGCMVNMLYVGTVTVCPCCRKSLGINPAAGLIPRAIARPPPPRAQRQLPEWAMPTPTSYINEMGYTPLQIDCHPLHFYETRFRNESEPPGDVIDSEAISQIPNPLVRRFAFMLRAFEFPNSLRISARELFAEYKHWLSFVGQNYRTSAASRILMREFEAQLAMAGHCVRNTPGVNLFLNHRVRGYNLFIKDSIVVGR